MRIAEWKWWRGEGDAGELQPGDFFPAPTLINSVPRHSHERVELLSVCLKLTSLYTRGVPPGKRELTFSSRQRPGNEKALLSCRSASTTSWSPMALDHHPQEIRRR